MTPALQERTGRSVLERVRRSSNALVADPRGTERLRRIKRSTVVGLAARVIQAVVGLVTVRVVLDYLGASGYGLFVATSSIVVWATLFDLGISNGLRNALSEAHGKDDQSAARELVATAFYGLSVVAVLIGIVFVALIAVIPWPALLNLPADATGQSVTTCILAAGLMVTLGLPSSVAIQIFTSYQAAYVASYWSIGSVLANLGGVLSAVSLEAGLPWLIVASTLPGLVVSAASLVAARFVHYPWLRLSLRSFSGRAAKRLAQSSIGLVVFQVGALLVNETDIVIITRRTSLGTVTRYSIVMDVYAVFISLVPLATNGYLPALREASERGDQDWVRPAFWHMVRVRMAIAMASSVAFVSLGNLALGIWLHGRIQFGEATWFALAALICTVTWVTAYSDFLTVMDVIWVQVVLVLCNGIVTTVSLYFLAPRYGVIGAIVAMTLFSLAILTWLVPRLATRRIPAMATG